MKAELRGSQVWFWCAGCNTHHAIDPTRWTWNGNTERPTFSPSVLVRSGHYADGNSDCWCNKDYGYTCEQCHSFVTDGRIQYLTDSTHHLSGQTVPLEDLP